MLPLLLVTVTFVSLNETLTKVNMSPVESWYMSSHSSELIIVSIIYKPRRVGVEEE